MYFVKARKHFEEQDTSETNEKGKRDRYQRTDSARLLLQALPTTTQIPGPSQLKSDGESKSTITDGKKRGNLGTSVDPLSDFKLEELPDGVCYRPKKDLTTLPTASSASNTAAGQGVPVGLGAVGATVAVTNSAGGLSSPPSSVNENSEQIRPAQYIGTFSVSGSDKDAREKMMEAQLEQMRCAKDRRAVNLMISTQGVRVILKENNNVFMDHSLKRIWYATCDPEYCQFSFLAREPKTSAEVQYCHAFVTETSEEAEDLISIIGEAFKYTYQEGKKQPTFHEIIEQQVQQQQAKFREIEQEAKNALQKKLKEIATPTPFSEKAQVRMERRRQSDELEITSEKKNWAKVQVERKGVTHILSPEKNYNASAAPNRRSEIPTRQTTPHSSPFKRNSVPPQAALSSNLVPSSSPPHPLSAMAIKESMETRNSNTKFKGSPVTALKNEIDRRLAMTNGSDIQPTIDHRDFIKEQIKLQQQQNAMANRPLPQPPDISGSPQRFKPATQQSPYPLQQRSLDDYHLPRSTSSQVPLSSSAANRNGMGNVKLRDSPRRKQPRPHSEIATSSSGAAGTGGVGGSSYYEQQRQSLLNNFTASFNLPPHLEGGSDGMYIYGPPSNDKNNKDEEEEEALYGQQVQARGRDFNRRAEAAGRKNAEPKNGRSDAGVVYDFQRTEGVRPIESSQNQGHHLQGGNLRQVHRSQSPRSGNVINQVHVEPVVPRYQNDSPFQNDRPEKGSKPPGLESLMCLDRSHIHDETLRNTPWYQAGLPREIALEILQQEEVGGFIVRDSSTHPGCYALSVRVPKYENASGISHYLILRTHRGVKLKGLEKEWSTLTALVTHHTVMREMLPCTLKLPKVKGPLSHQMIPEDGPGESTKDRSSLDSDMYNQLADMTGLVGKLKM